MSSRAASRAKTMEAKARARAAECRALVDEGARALADTLDTISADEARDANARNRLIRAVTRYQKALATVRRYQRKNNEAKE